MVRMHPTFTPFPYTTLFRSGFILKDESEPENGRMTKAWNATRPKYYVKILRFLLRRVKNAKMIILIKHTPHIKSVRSSLMKEDRKSTRLNSSHVRISYAVFC